MELELVLAEAAQQAEWPGWQCAKHRQKSSGHGCFFATSFYAALILKQRAGIYRVSAGSTSADC